MYLIFGILFLILLVFWGLNLVRRKKIIHKVRSLCMHEKCDMLNTLVEPFGYSYIPSQDLFTSRLDTWQRAFGYCQLYDRAAGRLGMIFDCLPVYFDYQGKTWLVEFWKGQYGINTGCEVGIYYADRILKEDEIKTALFHSVRDKEMPRISFCLIKDHSAITHLRAKHWWLTAFLPGCFSEPAELTLHASVTFASPDMTAAFLRGLKRTGYDAGKYNVHCNTVTISFDEGKQEQRFLQKLRHGFSQWKNRFWCRMYLSVTRPFCLSVDRILFLYYYLPFVFRKMLRIRKYRPRPGHRSCQNRRPL